MIYSSVSNHNQIIQEKYIYIYISIYKILDN